jgi:superfamily I DNA/RNA helicase
LFFFTIDTKTNALFVTMTSIEFLKGHKPNNRFMNTRPQAEKENTLENYLSHIGLLTNTDTAANKNTVKLMTVHTAKGLESTDYEITPNL